MWESTSQDKKCNSSNGIVERSMVPFSRIERMLWCFAPPVLSDVLRVRGSQLMVVRVDKLNIRTYPDLRGLERDTPSLFRQLSVQIKSQ